MIKYSVWLLQLVNYIDEAFPDLVYMLPDHIIQVPFEVLRMIKRESEMIVSSGIPLCSVNQGFSKSDDAQINTLRLLIVNPQVKDESKFY